MTTGHKPIPQQMRALQIVAPGHAEVLVRPVPTPAAGEVLLRVDAVTTCPHWDMHIFGGTPMFADRPLAYPYVLGEPGHEAVGTVAALGAGVSGFEVGQRVATWRDPGGRRQGCYAQYVAVAAEHVLAVPESLPVEAIASLELAMCVQVSVDQLEEIDAVRGHRVAIAGVGAAGLLALQMIKNAGASEIIAIEPDPARHDLARTVGADAVIGPTDLPAPDRFASTAFHAALDTSGLKVSVEALMSRTTRAVAIFGVLRERVQFGPEHWWGGFSLIGYGEHNVAAARRALESIESGAVQLSPLVSHRVGMAGYAKAVGRLRDRSAIKVLVDPWTDEAD